RSCGASPSSSKEDAWDGPRRWPASPTRPGARVPAPGAWPPTPLARTTDDYPVAGVSWYEAMAYAAFEGREVPTVFHWRRAAWGIGTTGALVAESNFANQGPAPVGEYPGLSEYGLHDMAGNVREWCLNEPAGRPGERFVLGGGWDDPTYVFADVVRQSPWDRS